MTSSPKHIHGLGRRKTAVALVNLGSKEAGMTVNGKSFEDYFATEALRADALAPLKITSLLETWGFKARVLGGGKRAQAQAVSLAIARALVVSDNAFRKQLKDAGLLTRDPRAKERKKFGLKRARRAPQFSKR